MVVSVRSRSRSQNPLALLASKMSLASLVRLVMRSRFACRGCCGGPGGVGLRPNPRPRRKLSRPPGGCRKAPALRFSGRSVQRRMPCATGLRAWRCRSCGLRCSVGVEVDFACLVEGRVDVVCAYASRKSFVPSVCGDGFEDCLNYLYRLSGTGAAGVCSRAIAGVVHVEEVHDEGERRVALRPVCAHASSDARYGLGGGTLPVSAAQNPASDPSSHASAFTPRSHSSNSRSTAARAAAAGAPSGCPKLAWWSA